MSTVYEQYKDRAKGLLNKSFDIGRNVLKGQAEATRREGLADLNIGLSRGNVAGGSPVAAALKSNFTSRVGRGLGENLASLEAGKLSTEAGLESKAGEVAAAEELNKKQVEASIPLGLTQAAFGLMGSVAGSDGFWKMLGGK